MALELVPLPLLKIILMLRKSDDTDSAVKSPAIPLASASNDRELLRCISRFEKVALVETLETKSEV